MRRLIAFLCALVPAAVIVAFGCLEVTPIVLPPRDAGFLPDASCSSCLQVPTDQLGCDDELEKCRVDPRCAPVLMCVNTLQCFDRPTLEDKLSCGLPCAIEAGITSTSDPTIGYLLGVLKCGQIRCQGPCNLGDASVQIDAL
jgi:hypothetical protein